MLVAGARARTTVRIPATGRIGPNAITRLIQALAAGPEGPQLTEILAEARLSHYLARPPESMVDESDVIALHRALRRHVGDESFEAITRDAGTRTADYLLAHRIPRPVQAVLKLLPASLAARVLLKAIGGHAWTFAGSGTFAWRVDHRAVLTLHDCPLARAHGSDHPVCAYYAGTFERLFRVLVHPRSEVAETACEAMGASACRFEVSWNHDPTSVPRS